MTVSKPQSDLKAGSVWGLATKRDSSKNTVSGPFLTAHSRRTHQSSSRRRSSGLSEESGPDPHHQGFRPGDIRPSAAACSGLDAPAERPDAS